MPKQPLPDKVPEICLVAPSQQLVDNTLRVCAKRSISIGAYLGVLNEALPIGKALQARGAKILISRKGTADLLSKHLDIQVVKINTTMNDYLRHIDLMRGHRGRIGIVEYITFIPELKKLCQYVGIPDALLYSYDSTDNYQKVVESAISGEATILLGGGALLPQLAQKLNIPHTIVENTEENIEIALDVALQLLKVQKEEEKKQNYFRLLSQRNSTILHFSNDAILATDNRGIITLANPMALSLLKKEASECVGQKISAFFSQVNFKELSSARAPLLDAIIPLRKTQYSVNFIPIVLGNQFEGVVCTFHTIQAIQETEQKIRMQLYEKGHVAKYHFSDIIGRSSAICRSKEIAASYAKAESTVLIIGETGTGKELFAQSIHNSSSRSGRPFVAINCAALGKDLLESQLFGYEEGAFTGAVKGGRQGLFEVAHGGTIFLDEIGEIPPETQMQLLRVLQEKEVRRVGSYRILPVDVRVICATNRDLVQEVQAGRFRRDLFYRINILRLDIPPLKDRREDIPLLISEMVQRYDAGIAEKAMPHIDALIGRLRQYDWPGNVRELVGLVERITTLSEHGVQARTLENIFLKDMTGQAAASEMPKEKPDKQAVLNALAQCGGSRVKAAELLGISRSTLWRLMAQFQI